MKNIIIIDPVCRNNEHYFFNFSILNSQTSIKLRNSIYFSCYKSNIDIINTCIKLNINVCQLKDYDTYITRIFSFFFKLFYSFRVLKSKNIILLSFDNTLIPLLFLSNFWLIPFLIKKITIISHNNLNTIKNSFSKRTIMRMFLYTYQPRIVLLSPTIAEEFRKYTAYKKVFGILHPNFRKTIANLEIHKLKKANNSNSEKTKIILVTSSYSSNFIGMINNNIDRITKMTSHIKNKIIVKYVSNSALKIDNINLIFFERLDKPTDMINYFNLISKADYVFFPQDKIANTRASGVLMDTLSIGTNFIGPNIGHFKDINSEYSLGHLYNNYIELIEIIEKTTNSIAFNQLDENKISKLYSDTAPNFLTNFLFDE